LANHGAIVCGPTLAKAMWLAVELEAIGRQYWHSLQVGGPVLLTEAEIADTRRRLESYGLQDE
jgi:L-fuculose-phosphate aldolase